MKPLISIEFSFEWIDNFRKDQDYLIFEMLKSMVVLVTGANGQLGQSIQFIANKYPNIQFIYTDYQEMILQIWKLSYPFLQNINPNFVSTQLLTPLLIRLKVNQIKRIWINAVGPENLAKVCKEFNTILVHISTDFIFFDGTQKFDKLQRNRYSKSKSILRTNEIRWRIAIQKIGKTFIIRTSWVYSQFANNLMKNDVTFGFPERDSLSVVNDQIGTPTNAVDLAEVLWL